MKGVSLFLQPYVTQIESQLSCTYNKLLSVILLTRSNTSTQSLMITQELQET
jgi:hypothetical protein